MSEVTSYYARLAALILDLYDHDLFVPTPEQLAILGAENPYADPKRDVYDDTTWHDTHSRQEM